METTPSPKQSRLFRNDAYFLQCVWKSQSEVVTGFDAPVVVKPTGLINGRGNFQFSHEKTPQTGTVWVFLLPASPYMVLQLQQVHVWEGRLGWWDCMFQSATLKTFVLLPNARMFLSKCETVYLHAGDEKVKTKSILKLSGCHAKPDALTVIDSCTASLVVAQNVNAAICGARQVSLRKLWWWEITSSQSRYDDGKTLVHSCS